MTGSLSFLRALAAILAVIFGAAGPAAAQDSVEQFFRGKTRQHLSSARRSAAATTATRGWSARHLGKHIPGKPTVVAQNMPGAGSNKAAGFVALQAPKDGTAIGAIQPGAVLWSLLFDQPVPHDPSKLILHRQRHPRRLSLHGALRRAGEDRSQEVLHGKEVIIGAAQEGSAIRDMPTVLVNMLGAKLRLVTGYAGSREVMIAIERNEVQGICGMGWSSISMQHTDWLTIGLHHDSRAGGPQGPARSDADGRAADDLVRQDRGRPAGHGADLQPEPVRPPLCAAAGRSAGARRGAAQGVHGRRWRTRS